MKTAILVVIGLLCIPIAAALAWPSPKYVVALEFKETGNLMRMSEDSYSTLDECTRSADYRLWTIVSKESGSKFICTKSKTKY